MTLPLRIPQLSFDRVGSGAPLLLLHGIGTGRADFTALVPELSESFDVIAMDLPGHGESAPCVGTPTVAAITDMVEHDLDAHGVGKVHVLGNSLGGRIALELAKRGRALSVVAMSPSGAAMPAERMIQGTLMAVARIGLRAGRPAIGVLAKHPAGRIALLAGLRARPWRASEAEALALRSGFASATKYWGTLVHAIMLDVPANLGSIKCPVVLTLGTSDALAAGQTMIYLGLLPGAGFRVLFGAGHSPQADTPGSIIKLVKTTAERAPTLRIVSAA